MEIYYLILRDYRKIDKQDDRPDFFSRVIEKLGLDTTLFHDLPQTLMQYTTINNSYMSKINLAKGGDDVAIGERDKYYNETWLPAVDALAKYIESDDIADGDKIIIEKSGFKPTADGKIKSDVPKQMHLEVKSMNTGELFYKSDTMQVGKGAKYFLICGTRVITNVYQEADGKIVVELSGPGKVIIVPIRKKQGTIKGMRSEDKYSCFLVAANAAGVGPLSQEAKVIIQ